MNASKNEPQRGKAMLATRRKYTYKIMMNTVAYMFPFFSFGRFGHLLSQLGHRNLKNSAALLSTKIFILRDSKIGDTHKLAANIDGDS
jgi:hypothetical protein